MCTSLEVISGGGRGREEDQFLTFKVSHMWVPFFYTRKRLREEERTKAGRREGGREGVEGEGDTISAECLGHYRWKDRHHVILSSHADWLWI